MLPVPVIIGILKAISNGAMGAYFGTKALKYGSDWVEQFFNGQQKAPDLMNTVQKKIEDFDISKIPRRPTPAPFYGGQAPNIHTLGGKSVLYDGNRSVSRWLWK